MFCHIMIIFTISENNFREISENRSVDNEFRHHRYLKIGKEYKFDIYTQEAHRCKDLKNAKKEISSIWS